jgi:hypothetical protein
MAVQFTPGAPQRAPSTAHDVTTSIPEKISKLGHAVEALVGAPADHKKAEHYDAKGSLRLRIPLEIGRFFSFLFGGKVSGSNVDKKA